MNPTAQRTLNPRPLAGSIWLGKPLTALCAVLLWSAASASAQPVMDGDVPAEPGSIVDSASIMTLEQALEHAFSQGFSVQAQQALVAQGQALQREAQARWRPQVNASVTYTLNDERIELNFPNPYAALDPWLRTVSAANPELPPASVLTEQPDTVIVSQLQHDLRGVLNVAQPIYQPVSAPLSEQGRSVERAAQAGVEATRQGVRDAVESLWFQALRFRRLQEVAQRNVELAELNYRRAAQAAELGAAQVFDVRRAQYALTQAQTAVASAQAGYDAARAQLAGALSLDAAVEPAEPPVLSPDAVLARLAVSWESRPEVRASQEQSAISLAAADVARASRLPFATVSGFVIPQTTTDFQDRPVDWFVQASVQWNVWDGGVRRAQSQRLEASAVQAQWQAQDVARQLQARFEAGRFQLADAVQRQAQAAQQLELATDEYEALQAAWSAGAATRLELDAALVRQFEAATLLALAEVDVQAAAYQVERLIAWE